MSDLNRYNELKQTILYHNDRYYNQDDPEISDYDYDMMMQELKKLEKKSYFPLVFLIFVTYTKPYMFITLYCIYVH